MEQEVEDSKTNGATTQSTKQPDIKIEIHNVLSFGDEMEGDTKDGQKITIKKKTKKPPKDSDEEP